MPVLSRADSTWRYCLLVLCGLGLVWVAGLISMFPHAADFGMRAKPGGVPYIDQVVVDPGSPADASGLRTGDFIDTRRLTPQARYRIAYGERVAEPIAVPVEGQTRAVTVVAQRAVPVTWDTWLYTASQVWVVLFCALLAWRRPESREVRLLVLFLLFVVVLGQSQWLTPSARFDAIAHACNTVILWGSFAYIVRYASLFGRPISPIRKGLGFLAYSAIVITVAIFLTRIMQVWSGAADPFITIPVHRAILLVASTLPLFAAIAAAHGSERTRVTWATLALAPACLWPAAADVFPVLAPARDAVTNVLFFVIPLVLTYSLLNRRLIDIGFVVNRAAIFTAVSVVVLGSFVLLEWLFSDWLRDASHTTNVLVSAGLALSLGLSVRFVHNRVDHIVDNVFFRKRHEDEQAIRTFAHEAPYITDQTTLLERAIAVLDRHTNASSVAVVLDDGDGCFGTVDENDPAIVRLRATKRTVNLHDIDSELRGDLAFPVVARGHLRGVIVLGARRSGEAYAPDESTAISALAHSLGSALDVLLAHNDESRDAILKELRDSMRLLIALSLKETPQTPN